MYMGGGKLGTLWHPRWFAVIMAFWSPWPMPAVLATSFAMLMASRFLLGLGRRRLSAATRAVAEWFAVKDRATAMASSRGHVGRAVERLR
jgi:hypothetical protein